MCVTKADSCAQGALKMNGKVALLHTVFVYIKSMKTNSYIKAVVFDLSEVLLSGLIGMRADLAIRLGVSTDSVDFRIPELKSLFEGRISEKDFWRALVKEMRWGIDPHELNLLVRAGFVEIMGTREIISNLKECGYTMGLFSVHAKEWINFCEKYFKYRNLFV